MESLGFLEHLGAGLLWQVALVGLALIAVVFLGVLLVQGRRVPPAVIAIPVFAIASSGTMVALVERLDWDPADLDRMRLVATTATAARFFGLFFTLPALGLLLLLLAVVGARGRQRNTRVAAAAAGVAVLTAAVTVIGGYAAGDPTFNNVRGVIYLGVGGLTAVAMLASDPEEGAGPEAGVAAALCYPLLVAAGEAARRGFFELLIVVMGAAQAKEHVRTLTIQNYYAGVSAEVVVAWLSIAAASLMALLGVLGITRGGARVRGAALGLVWLVGAAFVYGAGELGPARMAQFAEALPRASEGVPAP